MTLPSQSEGKDVEQIQPSCLVLVLEHPWGMVKDGAWLNEAAERLRLWRSSLWHRAEREEQGLVVVSRVHLQNGKPRFSF